MACYLCIPLNLARIAPATRFPATFDPYFLAADLAILEKFFPFLPISFPFRAFFTEYDFILFKNAKTRIEFGVAFGFIA